MRTNQQLVSPRDTASELPTGIRVSRLDTPYVDEIFAAERSETELDFESLDDVNITDVWDWHKV
jgi:hypothetical protein